MSLLANMTADDTIANETDSQGGSFSILPSGLYNANIEMAYLTTSKGGAIGLVLSLKTDTGANVKQTLWMSSGKAKGAKNYYVDKSGDKQYLPGFNHANSLAMLTLGKAIHQVDTEMKIVNIYDYDAKKEMPNSVEVPMDLLGQSILVGLIKQTVDKSALNDKGVYVPTGEVREENEIDKLFRSSDHMTTAEIRAKAEVATFCDTWSAKWTGVDRNKAKGVSGVSGSPAKPAPSRATGTAKPTTSLFAESE
jgi:hypothetical protein